jgi:hypothetical protein
MLFSTKNILVPLILCLGLSCWVGCAEGPLWRTGNLSPWVRQKWADEEKQYGATLRTKLSDLDALVQRAPSMDAQDRNQWSTQLSQLAMNDPSPLLRSRIIEALPLFPSADADAALRAAARDDDPSVRVAACTAWGKRGGREGLQVLSHGLEDDDIDVRLAAIRAMGDLKEPQIASETVRTLGVALEDKDPAIQYRAIESLRDVSGRDYGNNLVAWREFVQGGQPAVATPSVVERIRNWF